MIRTRDVLQRFPGRTEVVIIVDTVDAADSGTRLRCTLTVPNQMRVSCSEELRSELTQTVGSGHFELHGAPRKRNGHSGNGGPP